MNDYKIGDHVSIPVGPAWSGTVKGVKDGKVLVQSLGFRQYFKPEEIAHTTFTGKIDERKKAEKDTDDGLDIIQ